MIHLTSIAYGAFYTCQLVLESEWSITSTSLPLTILLWLLHLKESSSYINFLMSMQLGHQARISQLLFAPFTFFPASSNVLSSAQIHVSIMIDPVFKSPLIYTRSHSWLVSHCQSWDVCHCCQLCTHSSNNAVPKHVRVLQLRFVNPKATPCLTLSLLQAPSTRGTSRHNGFDRKWADSETAGIFEVPADSDICLRMEFWRYTRQEWPIGVLQLWHTPQTVRELLPPAPLLRRPGR